MLHSAAVMPRHKVYVSTWIDPDFGAEVTALAVTMGISRSELVRLALVQFVTNEKGAKRPRKERA